MDNVIDFVKKHPVPISIGVVVLILIVSASRGSSGSSSGNAYAAYAAQTSSQNAQANVALGAQSVELAKVQQESATARAGISAQLVASLAGLNAATAQNDSNNSTKALLATFSSADNRAKIAADQDIADKQINAGIRMNIDKINGDIQKSLNDNNFKLQQIGAQTQGNIALIQATAAEQLKAQRENNAFQIATLPTLLQSKENIARITGQNAVQIAQYQTAAARTAAQGQKNASDWGIVGDLIGGASKLFGFF